jgi:hypothetical protein
MHRKAIYRKIKKNNGQINPKNVRGGELGEKTIVI